MTMSDLRTLLGDKYDEVLAKALNDVLPREVLRQKADAWDEGRRLGLRQADYEMGAALNMPDLTNPYRQDSEGTEEGA